MTDYRLYVELLRNLADEAGIPKTLDSDDLEGIKTHYYCTYNQPNNESDHVDPYPYLAKWGISRAQFRYDIENGLDEVKEGWQKNATGWWYQNKDGSYPKDKWQYINGVWYLFDGSGYCFLNKWVNRENVWYWLDSSGAMATGWKKINNEWYFFRADGAMVTGWVKYADEWYFLDRKDGNMLSKQFVKSGNGWYYLNEDGTMAEKPEFTVEPDGLITAKEMHK